jgi:hypothetical protein
VAVFYWPQIFRKEVNPVSKYALPELLKLWHQEKLTVEQVLGQILLHLLALQKQLTDIQKQLLKPPPTLSK